MARPLSFSVQEQDVTRLAELQQRCWLMWLVSRGLPLGQASELAGARRISGWRYGIAYRERGIEGLLAEQWEGPPIVLGTFLPLPVDEDALVREGRGGTPALQRVGPGTP